MKTKTEAENKVGQITIEAKKMEEEKKAAGIMRRLAKNENFSLQDLDISFSYEGESSGEERRIEAEQCIRRFIREVEKRWDAIC